MKFTSAGITIAAVEGVPSTFDKAGFSVMPFVDIGKVSNIPAFGPTVQVVESNTLATGITEKYVGFVNYGSVAIEADYDDEDLGQELVSDAVTTTDPSFGKDFSFDLTYPNGSKRYWVGRFFSATESPNSANSMVSTSMNVEINSPILKVDSWVAQLDGATQSWVLSDPITVPADTDFKASFYINGINDGFEGLFSSSDPQSWLRLLPSNNSDNLQGQLGVGYYQAVPFSELNLRDGVTRKLSVERVSGRMRVVINDTLIFNSSILTSAFSIETLAKFASDYFGGVIYDFEFEISGVLTNKISLTNKEQGATQLATVGNINAFMPNYTEAVWRNL